jgi:hypothetical protein
VAEPLDVAVLGMWHVHASDYARAIDEHPDTRLSAVWDPAPERGEPAAASLGVEFVGDLDELLARDDIDAVTVTTATAEHHDVLHRGARHHPRRVRVGDDQDDRAGAASRRHVRHDRADHDRIRSGLSRGRVRRRLAARRWSLGAGCERRARRWSARHPGSRSWQGGARPPPRPERRHPARPR